MIMAIMLIVVLALVPLVIFNGVSGQIPIALSVQNSKAALAAAQTGMDSYVSLLTENISNVSYNDAQCTAPSSGQWDGFYFGSSSSCPSTYKGPNNAYGGWAPVPGSASAGGGLNESYVFRVDTSNASSGYITAKVTGRAGSPGHYRYRTVESNFDNPALSYSYFTNYETSSPFAYTNAAAFTFIEWVVSLVSGSLPASMKSLMSEFLGNGPVGAVKLGFYMCNYHAYQSNTILSLLDSPILTTMVDNEMAQYLKGLASFSIFGYPLGQEMYNSIESAVNSLITDVQTFLGPAYGPFPLLCNVNDMYNGYYGMTTNMSGKVYSNDSLYTCSPSGSTSNLNSATIELTSSKAGILPQYSSSATGPPQSYNPNHSLGNDLFAWSWSGSIPTPWQDYTWDIPILSGCANVTSPPATKTVTSLTPPVPDFEAIRVNASATGGCHYFGPTFIQLNGTSFQAWSPNTPAGSCPTTGGSAAVPSVIYVSNVATGSCIPFSSSSIVPNVYGVSSLPYGIDNLLQNHNCLWGDALVQGTLSGKLTIGASNDIVVTGNLIYACAASTNPPGTPVPASCPDTLGLAPGGNIELVNPATDANGTYYPQGNVVVVHPVDASQNDNNCPASSSVVNGAGWNPGGSTNPCAGWEQGDPGTGGTPEPNSVPLPPVSPLSAPSGSCAAWNVATWGTCFEDAMYDISTWAYGVEYKDFCGVNAPSNGNGSISSPVTRASASESTCTVTSLEDNWANTNTNAPAPPARPAHPTCNNWNVSFSFNWTAILSGNWSQAWNDFIAGILDSCGGQWLSYYYDYGAMGLSAGIQDICNVLGISPCDGGYEAVLQKYESTFTHGPVNPFSSVYNPTVDALVLASNSSPMVSASSSESSTMDYPNLGIVNGSFTLQNPTVGNVYATPISDTTSYWDCGSQPTGNTVNLCPYGQGSFSGGTHGLGTLTTVGSVVEQYANSLQNAGLSLSHFEFFPGGVGGLLGGYPSGCQYACFVPSGYKTVDFSYDPSELLNPPPYLLSSAGSPWTEMSGSYVETAVPASLQP